MTAVRKLAASGLAVALALSVAGAAQAATHSDNHTDQTRVAKMHDKSVPSASTPTLTRAPTPANIATMLSGVSSIVNLYKSCESSPSSFPECLTDSGPSLSDIQKQIKQLSSQISAFQQEFEADYAQLEDSIDAVSAQMYKESGADVVNQLKPALDAADSAMTNYNAFAACQMKWYSESTQQCTYWDSGGDGQFSGKPSQATLDAIRNEIYTSLDMNPNSDSQDQVRGDGRMLDPNTFLQLMGGQYTNPWNCATSAASAASLVATCGVMGNFFGNQAAGERQALGQPIDAPLTVFRPQFVNTMNSAAVQMQSILGNYLIVRSAAAQLMAATLSPKSQQAGWIDDLQSELTTLAKTGRPSAAQPTLSPGKVAQTYSAPPSAYPGGGDQPGYQLGNNWSFFVGDTTEGLLIESLAVNQFDPPLGPGTGGGTLPTVSQATTIANDLASTKQTWTNVSKATAIAGEPGLVIYPAAAGPDGTNPPAAGRLWTAPQTVYQSIVNSEWADVWGTYFWNVRLNVPGYSSSIFSMSGTAEPQSVVPFYTMKPVGIAGQTQAVSQPLIFNVFDKPSDQSVSVDSVQVCQDSSDSYCNLTSSNWTNANGHVYEDLWLFSTCQYVYSLDYDDDVYACNPDRQPTGSGSIVVVPGMSGIPPAVTWKVSDQPLDGILRTPADQTADGLGGGKPVTHMKVTALPQAKKLQLQHRTRLVKASTHGKIKKVMARCSVHGTPLKGREKKANCRLAITKKPHKATVSAAPNCGAGLKIRVIIQAKAPHKVSARWARTWKARTDPGVSCRHTGNG